jgi:integrase
VTGPTVLLSEFCKRSEEDNAQLPPSERQAASTLKLTDLSVRKLIRVLGDLPLRSIQEGDLLEFRGVAVKEDGETNAAVWLRHLGALFSRALALGLVLSNPVTKKVRIRQRVGVPLVMSREEVSTLMSRALEMHGPEFERQIRFLSLTGFRAGESCQLRRGAIDFERGVISHVNIKARRTVPFPIYSRLLPLLDAARSLPADASVFHYRSVSTLSHYFAVVRSDLKLNPRYTLHTLKKNFVSALIQARVPAMWVQALANHSDLKVTQQFYAWFDLDELRGDLERTSNLLA